MLASLQGIRSSRLVYVHPSIEGQRAEVPFADASASQWSGCLSAPIGLSRAAGPLGIRRQRRTVGVPQPIAVRGLRCLLEHVRRRRRRVLRGWDRRTCSGGSAARGGAHSEVAGEGPSGLEASLVVASASCPRPNRPPRVIAPRHAGGVAWFALPRCSGAPTHAYGDGGADQPRVRCIGRRPAGSSRGGATSRSASRRWSCRRRTPACTSRREATHSS